MLAMYKRLMPHYFLTSAGEKFLEEARRLVAGADRAVDVAQRTARGEIGSLTIGFVIWGTGAFFPGVIRAFRELYPGVQLSLMEMMSVMQSEALLKGTIDVAFTRPLEPPYDRQLRSESLYKDPLVAVLPARHRLAGRPLQLAALADERFVIFESKLGASDDHCTLCSGWLRPEGRADVQLNIEHSHSDPGGRRCDVDSKQSSAFPFL